MGMTENDKLLPCPMCGGEMELVNVEHSPLLLRNCVFKCKKGCIESVHSFNTEEEAIKACNTRKPMERILEQLENELKLSDEEKKRCAKENPMQFDVAKGYATGISNALDIVRKGGVDNAE